MSLPAPPRCHLLVLDDDEGFQALMRAFLCEDPAFHVDLASTAKQALGLLELTEPDVILVDVCLPDGDGIDLLPRLHSLAPQAHLLVNTGYASEDRRRSALQSGALRFIEKPFDLLPFRALLLELAAQKPRFVGTGVHLQDLIQMIVLARKSASIRFSSGQNRALLRFRQGVLVHVEDGEGIGEAAFFRAAQWDAGTFQALPLEEPGPPDSIHCPTPSLLLRALG